MELQLTICPVCGGTARLLQTRDDFEDVPDLERPGGLHRVRVVVEEFRCQEQSCENEFEKVVREPAA